MSGMNNPFLSANLPGRIDFGLVCTFTAVLVLGLVVVAFKRFIAATLHL